MSGGSTAFSAKEKEEEDVVAAGENAAQEERLLPIRMVVAVKTARVMVLSSLPAAMIF